jgi:hypothetical protein
VDRDVGRCKVADPRFEKVKFPAALKLRPVRGKTALT